MKKIIILLLFSFFAFVNVSQSAFGSSGEILPQAAEKTQTIRELQENAENLKKEQLRLEFQWSTFKIGNESLGDFIIELNENDLKSLSEIVTRYEEEKQLSEARLENSSLSEEERKNRQKDLLLLKKDFYTALIPYIKEDKLESYKNYISNDVHFNEKSKIVTREIREVEGQKKERIEVIQEKIEDNNRDLRESIEKKLRITVREKLDSFTQKETFASLGDAEKIIVFSRLKDKVKDAKKTFEENTQNTTSFVIDEKVFLLEVVEEIIENYISNWEE